MAPPNSEIYLCSSLPGGIAVYDDDNDIMMMVQVGRDVSRATCEERTGKWTDAAAAGQASFIETLVISTRGMTELFLLRRDLF